jgi:outer membrane lipopolysaccharide assembly protein LptE/RlpB
MSRARRAVAAVTLAALLLAAGCGYRLAGRGSMASVLPEGADTIGVPILRNDTEQPEIEQRVTEALIDELIRRGKIRAIPGVQGADILLEGVITSYNTQPVTFTPGGRFERVEVRITASIRLVQASPEEILWSQSHYVFREQYDVPESPLAEFDREIVAIDEISEDFARSVVTSILEGF